MSTAPVLTKKDFTSDQEVRWCPGCGDYAETLLIWMVLYVASYIAIAQMLGISIALSDAMVLLFAAAIGLAIPGAPSGVGTFHVAIVSAFLILGRPGPEGLVLAVGIHAVFFLGFCLLGILGFLVILVFCLYENMPCVHGLGDLKHLFVGSVVILYFLVRRCFFVRVLCLYSLLDLQAKPGF